jgi:hypothetical protein
MRLGNLPAVRQLAKVRQQDGGPFATQSSFWRFPRPSRGAARRRDGLASIEIRNATS